jgi:tetratricopeptide (TPR) repeat protein
VAQQKWSEATRLVFAGAALTSLVALSAAAQQSAPPQSPQTQQAVPTKQTSAPGRTAREDDELRADILMARKQYSEAAETYQKLLRQEPRNAILLNKAGIAYHYLQRLDVAKRFYQRSIRADRNYANAYNNLGMLEYDRKRFKQAAQDCRKAVEISPNVAPFFRNLGYAYFSDKKYDQAFDAFHQALAIDPQVFENSGRGFGTVLQQVSVQEKGAFFYFLAKSFASMSNGERCAFYLRKARDEGYQNLAAAKTDPAFAPVLKDPDVMEVLQITPPAKPDSAPPRV